MKRLFGLVWPHMRRHRKLLAFASGAMIGEVITVPTRPLKFIIDKVLLSHHQKVRTYLGHRTITVLVVASAVALLIAVRRALHLHRRLGHLPRRERAVNDLRLAVFAHIQRLSLAFHEHSSIRGVGDLLARLSGDIGSLQDLASRMASRRSSRTA